MESIQAVSADRSTPGALPTASSNSPDPPDVVVAAQQMHKELPFAHRCGNLLVPRLEMSVNAPAEVVLECSRVSPRRNDASAGAMNVIGWFRLG
jgi:hypothetical protein